jgi:hypothetical protein
VTRPPLLDVALLLGVLTLGSYLVLTAETPTTTEMNLRAENVLPAFSAEGIVALHFSVPHAFTLTRAPDEGDTNRYVLKGADQRPADEEAVRGVLRLLDLASWKRTLGAGGHIESSKLGFERPSLELRIDAGPRSYRILAGAKAPAPAHSVYLKVEGTNVETAIGVVDESVVSQLQKTEQEFLGGLVFPLARSETLSLRLSSQAGEVHLVPSEDSFFLDVPDGKKRLADRELVDLIFFQLARTKMESYLETPPEGALPLLVEQKGKNGALYRAELGAPCPQDPNAILVHRTSPTRLLGCASRTVMAALRVERSRLLSRAVTALNPDEIDHVVTSSPEKSLDILRSDHEYKLLSQGGKLIPQKTGDEFMKGLSSAQLTLLEMPPEAPDAVGKISIKGQGRNTALSAERERTDHTVEEQLEVFQKGDDLYVHRSSDSAWLSVSERDKWLFLPDDTWTKERKLASFSLTSIARVKVTLPGGQSWEVLQEDEKPMLTDPSRPADPALSRELFRTLAELEALRFDPKGRPRPPTGTLRVAFDVDEGAENKTWNLWVGERVQGGYLAWSDLTDSAFVLPLRARVPLELPLEDRRAFFVDAERLQRLEIETENRTALFERQGGVLRAAGGEANDDMVEPLTAALSALHVVSAGGKHPDARRIDRGEAEWTVHLTPESEGGAPGTPLTLHVGAPTVWQGISCRAGWIEGKPEMYFLEDATLSPLRELL